MHLGSAAVAEDRSPLADISKDAALFVSIYGDDADIFAAQKADALFRSGDMASGERWSAIFRLIAELHRTAGVRRS